MWGGGGDNVNRVMLCGSVCMLRVCVCVCVCGGG